jgi:hypothetical protein
MDTRTIVLELDEADYQAVMAALSRRRSWMVLPDGGGNLNGRLVAEVCRGWAEMLDSVVPPTK